MGAIATFDYKKFTTSYPEFNTLGACQVESFFEQAQLYHVNDGCGPVKKVESQLLFLNMVTAHLCQLFGQSSAQPPSIGAPQLVGAIQSASEGAVSVAVKNDYPPGTPQWWQQTRYGSAYWAATAAYRTMHYAASPGRNMNPFFPFGGRGTFGGGRR